MKLPFKNAETYHFVGIGGIGMSAIAQIMHCQGYNVQGSDKTANANVKRLRNAYNLKISIGHDAHHIDAATTLVISTAIKENNPELIAAKARNIPVFRRAEMLAKIMEPKRNIAVSGTHGKTSTTAMIAAMLAAGEKDPTVINGGIIPDFDSNAKMGKGEWLVTEADESDGSFLELPVNIAVVTNIDPEHMDYHRTKERLSEAFSEFIGKADLAIVCLDDSNVKHLISNSHENNLVTYGLNPSANVRAIGLRKLKGKSIFDVIISDNKGNTIQKLEAVCLCFPGEHNIVNALAAIAIAKELKLSDSQIKEGLEHYRGVERRFTQTGEVSGVCIIDDYAHHPREIRAALNAARQNCNKKIIAIMQPHRYTRLRDLFDDFSTCFDACDMLLITDVYSAGEPPIDGYDSNTLLAEIQRRGHISARKISDFEELAKFLSSVTAEGDMIIFMGAGNITDWANALPSRLEALL